jgi:D-beta-D-heptose 7-phosphate kinase/D-beta-D-heptose 1-phosphate adenosyltransferase
MNIVLVTGGFDPLHSGHIAYFEAARALGDKLIVGLNSDAWLERKKGRAFMPITERVRIVESLKMVDGVVLFNDDDGSAREAIHNVKMLFPNDQVIFANGGDRNAVNIPELGIANVLYKFGVGGETKLNSSSWILEEWKAPKIERPWGYYRVLYESNRFSASTKVKELTVEPGQSLSMQRHRYRNEMWHVVEGKCNVHDSIDSGYNLPPRTLVTHERIDIPMGQWHKLSNPFTGPCRIIEIQYGDQCEESDIERKSS